MDRQAAFVGSITLSNRTSADGPRPINLRTDLGPLADLIEMAFADSMDSGGRAAVREMRYLSKMGVGLSLLGSVNDLVQGISMGFVWITGGRLVGNVSVYPANWPADLGKTWIIANVAVHPDYQRRGIATQLMQASLEMIREQGGQRAILQVDLDNYTARRLYTRLGFINEIPWTLWRRSGTSHLPAPYEGARDIYITQRRPGEWRAEYELAQRLRPQELGGLGWMRPLHPSQFRQSVWRRLGEWISFQTQERLVIRSEDERHLLASLRIERSLGANTDLVLLVEPEYQGLYDEALINLAVRRFGGRGQALVLEHPSEEAITSEILRRYQFRSQREVMHMRWEVR
jgi:ribosomal protein S18 acetylase RimI-like enzyme